MRVEMVGDVLDTSVLERAGVATARVVILACDNDNATLLAATVVRDFAADVPIIACAKLADNVGRIQQVIRPGSCACTARQSSKGKMMANKRHTEMRAV